MPTKLADGLGLRDVPFYPLLKKKKQSLETRPEIWFLRSSYTLLLGDSLGTSWIRLTYSYYFSTVYHKL
jgi:hypothetical protein